MRTFTAILQRHALHILILLIAGLATLGIVMLYSTGAFALQAHGDQYYFLKRQSLWLVIGAAACITAALVDYHVWQKLWWPIFLLAIVLLVLCFVPPIGQRIKGASRWIDLGFMNFQPSELAKVAAVFFLAWWYSKFAPKTRTFLMGFMIPMAVVSILMALIVIEVDLGATALIGGATFAIMFVAGTRLLYLVPLVLAGLGGVAFAVTHIEERLGRVLAFIHPDKYPDEFYQQLQGLIAFGSGGFAGFGLGEGRQKWYYLPEAHTDFIFPMIGEELGMRFALLVVIAYIVIALCGFMVAVNSRDRFGTLLGFGMVIIILLQAAVNIGVTTALLPNKGMPLPFISFGGSNLMICLFMIGVLINIHRHGHPIAVPMRKVRLAARVTPRI